MNFYIMTEDLNNENSIELDKLPENIDKRAILLSELQFITKEPVEIMLTERSGDCITDICDYMIPLLSDKLKKILDENGVDYFFYKPIYLKHPLTQNRDLYWLSLAPQIDCVNWENSKYEDALALKNLIKFQIKEELTGRFEIFKLKKVQNQFMIVNEKFKQILETKDLNGVKFIRVEDYKDD